MLQKLTCMLLELGGEKRPTEEISNMPLSFKIEYLENFSDLPKFIQEVNISMKRLWMRGYSLENTFTCHYL